MSGSLASGYFTANVETDSDEEWLFDGSFGAIGDCAVRGTESLVVAGTALVETTRGSRWDPRPPALVDPPDGHVGPSHGVLPFTVLAEDYSGGLAYSAHIVVRDAVTGAVVATGTTAHVPQGQKATGVVDRALPPGNYRWTASISVLYGGLSQEATSRSLTIPANRPPTPSAQSPASGASVALGTPVTFSLSATDPEGQQWVGRVEVRSSSGTAVGTYVTPPTASGQTGSTSPPAGLPPGTYTWSATATDSQGASSAPTTPRSFTVRAPANTAPGSPTLVAPSGSSYSFGEPATFTVRANDANLDPYRAHITIRRSDGTEHRIDTLYTASGTDASGSPAQILPAGSYTWWAVAEDVHGATGPSSVTGTFTVTSGGPFLDAL